MPCDIFISYSNKDEKVAKALVSELEKEGIKCFISFRDIENPESKTLIISKTIKACPVMVMIFSENSCSSKEIGKEITLAMNTKTVIIPFHIDKSMPSDEISYHLANTQWLNASNPFTKAHVGELVTRIKQILPSETPKEIEIKEDHKTNNKPKKKKDTHSGYFSIYIAGAHFRIFYI